MPTGSALLCARPCIRSSYHSFILIHLTTTVLPQPRSKACTPLHLSINKRAHGVQEELLRSVRAENVEPDGGGKEGACLKEEVEVLCSFWS